ncbi:hypothetical protein BACCIP111895_03064 [Neobacillus rhizosphaerae]|uniref:IS110 family transposase n=1 Tax=Neobacillus rhizosphaerae TaxID=2880965 RepID=A0ABN8KTP1_9BACI|nr:hypothetical protein [Neobacillus rhizosphaerae]CAH2715880.1 hypothetical protein BACCIP111895_03064 [Neobacillus rhizosphaerae]
MDVVIERACGMDVHKDNISACIITPEGKEIQIAFLSISSYSPYVSSSSSNPTNFPLLSKI